jgi:hypothetical protein
MLSPIKPALSSPIGEQRTRIRLGVESMTVAGARHVSTAFSGRIRPHNPCVVAVMFTEQLTHDIALGVLLHESKGLHLINGIFSLVSIKSISVSRSVRTSARARSPDAAAGQRENLLLTISNFGHAPFVNWKLLLAETARVRCASELSS